MAFAAARSFAHPFITRKKRERSKVWWMSSLASRLRSPCNKKSPVAVFACRHLGPAWEGAAIIRERGCKAATCFARQRHNASGANTFGNRRQQILLPVEPAHNQIPAFRLNCVLVP